MVQRDLRHRIEKLIGRPVEVCRPVQGGYTPAVRLLCKASQASFFVKVGVTPSTSQQLRREIYIYNSISGDFMPKLVGWEEDEGEPILIIEDLSAHHWPPPWSEWRVDLVLAQISTMHNTRAELESLRASTRVAYCKLAHCGGRPQGVSIARDGR